VPPKPRRPSVTGWEASNDKPNCLSPAYRPKRLSVSPEERLCRYYLLDLSLKVIERRECRVSLVTGEGVLAMAAPLCDSLHSGAVLFLSLELDPNLNIGVSGRTFTRRYDHGSGNRASGEALADSGPSAMG